MLKAAAKSILPKPVWRALHRAKTIRERQAMWSGIERDLAGVTAADRDALADTIARGKAGVADNIDGWQTPIASGDLTVTQGALRFFVRGGSDDLYSIWAAREGAITDALKRLLKPGDVFVDAGANVGFFTVIAATLVGPTGRVYAVEMMAETASALRRNVALNGLDNVTVIQQALSDTDGQTIRATVPDALWGQASIARDHTGLMQNVETTTLDAVLAGAAFVRLIKMDVEGAELLALCGARKALMQTGAIIFERQRDPEADEAIEDFLHGQAMTVSDLDPANGYATRKYVLAPV